MRQRAMLRYWLQVPKAGTGKERASADPENSLAKAKVGAEAMIRSFRDARKELRK